MSSIVEYYCPPNKHNSLLEELKSINIKQPNTTISTNQNRNIVSQNVGKTSILTSRVNINPSTSKELISFSGQHTILSFAMALKNPVLSLQNVEISIKMDDTIYKDTLINTFMVMKLGKGFRMKYYEEITNVDINIADTLYNSGSIFYMYITEPIVIANNFSILINNTNIASTEYDASIKSKTMYTLRGV